MKIKAKKNKAVHISLSRKVIVLTGIGLIVAGIVLIAARGYQLSVNAQRLSRIEAIYASLNLPYTARDSFIFGEKRPYDWAGGMGKGRTESSSMSYWVGKPVDATAAEFRAAIEKVGFHYIGEPYPGSLNVQYHFKSAKGEYIRLTVSSKIRDDAFHNASILNQSYDSLQSLDANAAPSNVIVKVNLDDNNE